MRATAATLTLALALVASPAAAYTQWTAALTLGGGARVGPATQRALLVTTGLRADVLFGSRDPRSVRVGPFAAGYSDDLATLVAAAGLSVQLPVSTDAPLVLSAGATYDLTERARLPVGLTGRVWWGSRSVNLHAAYGMAAGLWVEGRYAPDGGALDVVVGLDGDLGFITLPVVVLWNWLTR